jgi:hypothetical protein
MAVNRTVEQIVFEGVDKLTARREVVAVGR